MKNVYMILCATALVVGLGMSPAYAGQPEDSERTCTDGKDNDRNGLIDCEEATCAPFCGGGCTVTEDPEVSCSDGVDNDCDGDIDDADTDCAPVCTPTEDPEVSCSDGVDNDCDGDTDGADPDCDPVCTPTPEGPFGDATCTDGVDNDCDGATDGADSDCQSACVPDVLLPHKCLTAADYPTACLGCHDNGEAGSQYDHAYNSVHYKWTGPGSDMTNQPGTEQGKLTDAMNTYCINILGNWGVCGTCHAGRGVKPGEGDTKANVDCLMCHNELYALARVRLGDGSMGPAEPTDSMYQPATPTKTNCLKCHAFGGGGNGIKRGDIANELIANTDPEYDVHMNNAGANLQCISCHSFNGMHQVSGKGSDLRPTDFESEVSCESCHANDGNGGWSHEIAGVRGEPDRHMAKVSCQACHIPTYGKTHTETHREWRVHITGADAETCTAATTGCVSHPNHDSNTEPLVPTYKFWNRMSDNYLLGDVAEINPDTGNTYQTSMPQGDVAEGNGKLYPFKYKTSEAPISNEGLLIAVDTYEYLKVSGNINTAIAQGMDNMKAAGVMAQTDGFDSSTGWKTSDTYQLITHGITPAASITGCDQCHGTWDIDNENMLDAIGYKLKGTNKFDVCNQCHDGDKKLPRTHERMHGHIDKGSGIGCAFCHSFERPARPGCQDPCAPCASEFVDNVAYPDNNCGN